MSNTLATDLEALGLKAIAGAVRNGSVSVDRALTSVERKRDRLHAAGLFRAEGLAQAVLDRHRETGS